VIVASYNVHRCIGRDARCDPDRVADVIREMEADVIGLQEVGGDTDQVAYLAERAGYHAVAGPTLLREDGHFGNALLTRLPPRAVRLVDLSIAGREPRGAIDADLDVPSGACRVIVTHLGLRGYERRRQVEMLLTNVVEEATPDLVVLLGDLNEWLGPARVLRRLRASFACAAVASFPALRPVLALDRVLVRPASAFVALRAHDTPLARWASDHLPVWAELRPAG
jgi:endonuclease/exonuclease/phosphatase family metal-dependent hydrolase